MDDMLINKEAALDAMAAVYDELWEIDIPSPTIPEYVEHHEGVQKVMIVLKEQFRKIKEMPSIKAESVRESRWKGEGFGDYSCILCGEVFSVHTVMWEPKWNYCPNCGAKMNGEDNG